MKYIQPIKAPKTKALTLNNLQGKDNTIEKSLSIKYISCEQKEFSLNLKFEVQARGINHKETGAYINVFRGDIKQDSLTNKSIISLVEINPNGRKNIEIVVPLSFTDNEHDQINKYYRASVTVNKIWAMSEGFKINVKKDEQTEDCKKNFEKIVNIILEHEGGYVDDPNDKGGKTNLGIAWRTWIAYAKKDLNLEPTVNNLKKLTKEQASVIYLKRYWEPKGFCKVKNPKLALMIYDWTITSGGAITEIQKLLVNDLNQSLNINGKMENEMIEILNSYPNQQELYDKITQKRKDYYIFLSYKTNPDGTFKFDSNGEKIKTTNHKFLNGWLNRVNSCTKIKI